MPDDERMRRLLDAAVEGDDVALSELIRCSQPVVWRVCAALGSGGDEADLVQETYLKAIRALPTYRHQAPVVTWLASIARHVCADEVRRRQRRRRLLDKLKVTADAHHGAQPEIVDDLLAQIDDDRRHAFLLTQYVGMSYEEAAFTLGCPIGTVRSRVARARNDLGRLLGASEAI